MQACFCFDRESVELSSKGQNSLLVVPWTLNWLLFNEETWEARRRERICWSRMYSESLFHVLKLYNLPPLFSNYIFYSASKWARSSSILALCLEKHFAEKGLFI